MCCVCFCPFLYGQAANQVPTGENKVIIETKNKNKQTKKHNQSILAIHIIYMFLKANVNSLGHGVSMTAQLQHAPNHIL